jgi:small subunit ribosomal protein S16
VALKIRLARGGVKKRPFYSVVVTDSRNPRDGAFLEKVGTYNPLLPQEDESRATFSSDRIDYWISVGAKPSSRVAILLSFKGLRKKPDITNTPKKSSPKKKAVERLKQQQQEAAS